MMIQTRQQPPQTPWTPLQRAAQTLPSEDNRIHVDGVRWDIENDETGKCTDNGVFGDAYIDPKGLKDVYLCVKPFTQKPGNLPGHALLNFEFKPESPIVDSQGHQDKGLAVSVEVHYKQGQEYDPTDTTSPVIYQLGTWSDAVEKATAHDHNPLHYYKLKLNDEQKEALLRERLSASVADHEKDIYNPVSNSCLSTLIDGVNTVLPDKQKMSHTTPDGDPDPNATVPLWCPTLFRTHALLMKPTPDVIPAK